MKTLVKIALLAILLLLVVLPLQADHGPVSDELRTDLARLLVGEADGSEADWAALLWTLRHRQERADVSLRAVTRYSAVFKGLNPRARRMLTLGTEAPDYGPVPELRRVQWEDALQFVDAWLLGDVPDPCPNAYHWRGIDDPPMPPGSVRVWCGPTTNEFFYKRRKSP